MHDALSALPRRLRAALAAGAAQRVLQLYTDTAAVYSRAPMDAIEAAWRYAVTGELDEDEMARIDLELDAAHPGPDGGGPDLFALTAAGAALDAIRDDTADAAAAACSDALAAVEQVDAGGAEEERRWQTEALELVKAAGARPIERGMFSALGEPRWLARFEGRSSG